MSEETKKEIETLIDEIEVRLCKVDIDQETYEFENKIYDFLCYLVT